MEQGADQIDLPPPPALGRAQERTKGPGLTLEALQEIAVKNNPTLTQAEAEIRAAQGRALQVGLYPNPVLGYTGDEIRGGAFRGGIHGAFIQQTIVLGGKLGLSRRVAEQEVRLAEIERDEQRLRVTNAVRLAYYQVLATQERLETEKAFVQLSADAVETSYQFRRVGQFDQTEALQAEIELEAAEVAVIEQENELRQRWMQLAAVVGDPNLPFATLRGRLDENLPELSREQVIEAFMASPAVRIARAFEVRAEATIARERREPVPDLQIRAATHYNRELREPVVGSTGVDSALEIGIQIPLFNRNQGAVQAARADLERAQQETRRVQLRLRAGASTVLQQYESTRAAVERYRERMIPRAQRAYGAMVQRWGQMAASYPQLLMSQRTLFALQRNYITALENLWTTSIGLQGLLLTDGLEAPARPGEVDLPMSGISVPNSMETRQMESLR
ncbi:MAG: TolC family protein [Candidatus Korobacteraceae bacterium]